MLDELTLAAKHFVTLSAGHGVLYIISEDVVFEAQQTYNSLFLQ